MKDTLKEIAEMAREPIAWLWMFILTFFILQKYLDMDKYYFFSYYMGQVLGWSMIISFLWAFIYGAIYDLVHWWLWPLITHKKPDPEFNYTRPERR